MAGWTLMVYTRHPITGEEIGSPNGMRYESKAEATRRIPANMNWMAKHAPLIYEKGIRIEAEWTEGD